MYERSSEEFIVYFNFCYDISFFIVNDFNFDGFMFIFDLVILVNFRSEIVEDWFVK